jgi:hypothetical protein
MKSNNNIQSLLSNKDFTFVNNKYLEYYVNLIVKCKNENRKKLKPNDPHFIYYESHHILPESFGGHNVKDNLVLFTVKEHLVAHHLLTKCTIGKAKGKMIHALHRFFNGNKNQKQIGKNFIGLYERNKIERWFFVSEWSKKQLKQGMKGKKHSLETINKMRDAWDDEKKQKMRDTKKGKKNSIETKIKKSNCKKGNKNPMFGKTALNRTIVPNDHLDKIIYLYKIKNLKPSKIQKEMINLYGIKYGIETIKRSIKL